MDSITRLIAGCFRFLIDPVHRPARLAGPVATFRHYAFAPEWCLLFSRADSRLLSAIPKLKSLVPEFQKAKGVEDVERLLSKFEDMIVDVIRRRWPLEICDQPESWGSAIAEGLTAMPNFRWVDRGQLLLALHDESQVLDRVQKLEQFDVKIDRSIKRLMQAKTMKQMYRQLEPKVITIAQAQKGERSRKL